MRGADAAVVHELSFGRAWTPGGVLRGGSATPPCGNSIAISLRSLHSRLRLAIIGEAMAHPPLKVLGICGSLRKASFNMAALRACNELLPSGMSLRITT